MKSELGLCPDCYGEPFFKPCPEGGYVCWCWPCHNYWTVGAVESKQTVMGCVRVQPATEEDILPPHIVERIGELLGDKL